MICLSNADFPPFVCFMLTHPLSVESVCLDSVRPYILRQFVPYILTRFVHLSWLSPNSPRWWLTTVFPQHFVSSILFPKVKGALCNIRFDVILIDEPRNASASAFSFRSLSLSFSLSHVSLPSPGLLATTLLYHLLLLPTFLRNYTTFFSTTL